MARIIIKNSNVEGRVPLLTDLSMGELALNTFDGKLFFKINDGTESVIEVGGTGGVDINTKADKVVGAVVDNFAGLDVDGNLTDSGMAAASFATAAQGLLADTALQDLSASSINDLVDVDTTGIAVDQILKWNGTAFVAADEGGGVDIATKADKVVGAIEGNLASLDVDGNLVDSGSAITDFASSEQGALADTALQDLTSSSINDLIDVDTTGIAIDQILKWNGTAFVAADEGGGVDITTKADKVVGAVDGNFAGLDADGNLTDSGSAAVSFATAAQGALADTALQNLDASSIGDLSDVDTTGIAVDQILKWNGTAFVAADDVGGTIDITGKADKVAAAVAGNFAGLAADGNLTDSGMAAASFATAAQGALADTALQNLDASSINDLSDVDTTGIAVDQILKWNGTAFVAADESGGADVSAKADKVVGAVDGNFAGLDVDGNLTDSGMAAASFATAAQGALADTALQDLSASSINDLVDVDTTGIVIDQILKWNGTAFVAADDVGGTIDITGKADKVAAAVAGNFAGLAADGNLTDSGLAAASFATAAQGALADTAMQNLDASSIGDLSDVDTTGIAVDQILKWNGTAFAAADDAGAAIDITVKADKVVGAVDGNFAGLDVDGNLTDSGLAAASFATAAQGALADTALQDLSTSSIDGLSDVDMTGITSGQVLKWNGSIFMPADDIAGEGGVPEAPLTDGPYGRDAGAWTLVATAAQGALADSALQNLDASSIGDLSDVDTTGILNGQVLKWNGTAFIGADDITGTGGVPEAPIDGVAYGRQDGAWVGVATAAQGALAESALQADSDVDGGTF